MASPPEPVRFSLTAEPIHERAFKGLPPEVRDRVRQAGERARNGTGDQIPVLAQLVAEFPSCPAIGHILVRAYQFADRHDKVAGLIEESYRKFPDNLFSMCNYGLLRMGEGRIEEVTAILQSRFSLHLWIKDRRVYHVSEFVIFHSLMVMYFLWLSEWEAAEAYVNLLLRVAPDEPQTRRAVAMFETIRGSLVEVPLPAVRALPKIRERAKARRERYR